MSPVLPLFYVHLRLAVCEYIIIYRLMEKKHVIVSQFQYELNIYTQSVGSQNSSNFMLMSHEMN